MNTPSLRPTHRRHGFPDTKPLRFRAEPPAGIPRPRTTSRAAENDFLVANPRPDLTTDPQTLRMIEAG